MGTNLDNMSASNNMRETERTIGNIQTEPTKECVIAQEGIEKYIEKPCIEACRRLWDLNIVTYESSGNEHGGWIAIPKDGLSEENSIRLKEAMSIGIDGYSDEISYKEYSGIEVSSAGNEDEVSSKLLELTTLFEMQDIKEGVYTREGFLVLGCNCCSNLIEGDGTINRTFDPKKMTKSFEEYVAEKAAIYIPEEGRVYLNDYYLQKHKNYLKYLAETKPTS
jgi:hypothetical protein